MEKDKVKQKIQELCPDVMEHASVSYKFDIISKDKDGREYSGFCPDCFMTEVEASQKPCERKITLAVVLRAIIKTYPPTNRTNLFLDVIERWNLLADNYDLQSEETKQFIGEILEITKK